MSVSYNRVMRVGQISMKMMNIKVNNTYQESFEYFTRFIVKIYTSTIFIYPRTLIYQSKYCLNIRYFSK